jgi:hypothetical protein
MLVRLCHILPIVRHDAVIAVTVRCNSVSNVSRGDESCESEFFLYAGSAVREAHLSVPLYRIRLCPLSVREPLPKQPKVSQERGRDFAVFVGLGWLALLGVWGGIPLLTGGL